MTPPIPYRFGKHRTEVKLYFLKIPDLSITKKVPLDKPIKDLFHRGGLFWLKLDNDDLIALQPEYSGSSARLRGADIVELAVHRDTIIAWRDGGNELAALVIDPREVDGVRELWKIAAEHRGRFIKANDGKIVVGGGDFWRHDGSDLTLYDIQSGRVLGEASFPIRLGLWAINRNTFYGSTENGILLRASLDKLIESFKPSDN